MATAGYGTKYTSADSINMPLQYGTETDREKKTSLKKYPRPVGRRTPMPVSVVHFELMALPLYLRARA